MAKLGITDLLFTLLGTSRWLVIWVGVICDCLGSFNRTWRLIMQSCTAGNVNYKDQNNVTSEQYQQRMITNEDRWRSFDDLQWQSMRDNLVFHVIPEKIRTTTPYWKVLCRSICVSEFNGCGYLSAIERMLPHEFVSYVTTDEIRPSTRYYRHIWIRQEQSTKQALWGMS